MVFVILIGASIFNCFIELRGLTATLTGAIENAGSSPVGLVVMIVLSDVVLGCFMASLSMVQLTVVPMFQLVTNVGHDPIWFGILVFTVAEIGLITPRSG